MENKKDIGKAISDKLSTLDKSPRENVWSGISYELQKKKKRRIAFFFFWTKTIGLLLIGVMAALYVYNQNNGFDTVLPKDPTESIIVNGNGGKTNTTHSCKGNTATRDAKSASNNSVVNEEDNNAEKGNSFENNSKNKSHLNNKNASDHPNGVNSKNRKGSVKATGNNNSVTKSSKMSKKTRAYGELSSAKTKQNKTKSNQFSKVSRKKSAKKGNGEPKTNTETSSQTDINSKQNTTALFDPTSLQNKVSIDKTKEVNSKKTDSLIAKKEKEKKKNINMYPEDKKVQDSAKRFVRFHVDAFLSPTHYGYFSDQSTLSRFLDANSKSTEMQLNYGAGLSYDLTERVTIRLGYTNVKLNYTTHDALVNTPNYSGIQYNPGVTNESVYAASNGAETMNITQNMTYNELSLEGRYKFLDKKIGLSGIFGFSFLMLNDNTVSVTTSNGFGQTIGKTKYLFNTGVSANIGFGLDYQVFKNTKIFAEPMFNYQAAAFENSNFKPYYFGFHFGVRYALINK